MLFVDVIPDELRQAPVWERPYGWGAPSSTRGKLAPPLAGLSKGVNRCPPCKRAFKTSPSVSFSPAVGGMERREIRVR